jgi:hypothetical protein
MNVAQRKNLSPYWNIIGSSTAEKSYTPTYYFPDALIMHGLAIRGVRSTLAASYYTGHRKGHSYAVRDYKSAAGVRSMSGLVQGG